MVAADHQLVHERCLAKQLAQFADYIARCTFVESISIEPTDDNKAVVVRATWPGEGVYTKRYELSDLYRACRTRRQIVGDILRARGVGKKE